MVRHTLKALQHLLQSLLQVCLNILGHSQLKGNQLSNLSLYFIWFEDISLYCSYLPYPFMSLCKILWVCVNMLLCKMPQFFQFSIQTVTNIIFVFIKLIHSKSCLFRFFIQMKLKWENWWYLGIVFITFLASIYTWQNFLATVEVPNFKILPMTAIMMHFPLQRLTGLFAMPFPLPWMSFAEVEAYLAL